MILAALVGLGAAPAADGRMSIVYDEAAAVRALTDRAGPGAPLGADRGLYRQDPGPGGIFDAHGRDARHRVGKVSAAELAAMTAEGMAARLAREIERPAHGAASGLVAIDEVGNRFNDGRVRARYVWRTVRGTRIRLAAWNRLVVTRRGWRVERGTAPLPRIDPESPGARLGRAMRMLAERPHPAGGTYADRVHLYIAPAFSTSIAAGRGPHRHLGNDGKPHRATWRGVMPAVALAGGAWVEMYHHDRASGITAMTARTWRTVPRAFSGYLRRFGGDPGRLHLLFTAVPAPPRGAPRGCGGPMACQWALARATPAGRAMLANGPGAYRVGAQARAWRAEFNREFGSS